MMTITYVLSSQNHLRLPTRSQKALDPTLQTIEVLDLGLSVTFEKMTWIHSVYFIVPVCCIWPALFFPNTAGTFNSCSLPQLLLDPSSCEQGCVLFLCGASSNSAPNC